MAAAWLDQLRAQPGESLAWFVVLAACAYGVGVLLHVTTRRSRTLRHTIVAITIASLAIAAAATLALARLMVLDTDAIRTVAPVLVVTVLFAVILVSAASRGLTRDAERLEATVRDVAAGRRDVRSAVDRADELGLISQAVDELTEQLDELEQQRASYEAERQQMLTSVGHDLRTPLSALRAATEALADGVAADPDRYVRSMQRDVAALSALVEDLFLLARIEGGRVDLHREVIDLAEIVDEAAEALAPVAAARHIEVTLEAAGRTQVVAHPASIGRVVRNLVDNAIRHAPDGSGIHLRVDGGPRPTVHVIDEGPGFPQELGDRAFDTFARAEPSRNRSTGGSGLGLTIARGLVEGHGGRIWIEPPAPGRTGAHVAIDLPAAAI
ncbi:hypothetical protein BH24ACT5_BH24ACT5_23670 [soil metagenome]